MKPLPLSKNVKHKSSWNVHGPAHVEPRGLWKTKGDRSGWSPNDPRDVPISTGLLMNRQLNGLRKNKDKASLRPVRNWRTLGGENIARPRAAAHPGANGSALAAAGEC